MMILERHFSVGTAGAKLPQNVSSDPAASIAYVIADALGPQGTVAPK